MSTNMAALSRGCNQNIVAFSGRATVRHFDPFNLMTYHYKNIFFIKRLFYLNYLIILMSMKG